MNSYRVYLLDAGGHIMSGEWLEADTDEEALGLACTKFRPKSAAIEVWCGARRIATVTQDDAGETD